jgi:hypothetical protein
MKRFYKGMSIILLLVAILVAGGFIYLQQLKQQ